MSVEPRPGLVIRYAYLWREEAARGQEEGKDRPCAVVLAVRTERDRTRVYVAPITHSPPKNRQHALAIPPDTKGRLGLDEHSSWVKFDELNVFTWPGPDVRPISRGRGFVYGLLPRNMIVDILDGIRELHHEKRSSLVNRDD